MEKGKSAATITSSLKRLDLNCAPKSVSSYRSPVEKVKPRRLVSLCLGVLGQHFEDIIEDLNDIVATFPADVKMALTAIARRRNLLNDNILITLAESSWDVLDISGSDVTDFGLGKVAGICKHLRAVDISHCRKITSLGVSELLSNCSSLEILRWGGCPRSDFTACSSLSILKPKLNVVEGDSWEELDNMDLAHGAQSLHWLVWPKIDDYSRETLTTECPRIVVNPRPSPLGFRGVLVPHEALPDVVLDDPIVNDIDPKTWNVRSIAPRREIPSISGAPELPMAERFRLAFMERDARLAPKRAKNARQHRRRAEREWVTTSTNAKSIALASQASKLLHMS